MSELKASLGSLGLQEYSESLVSHGFKTWTDVMGISEDSLADIGFKLGHRRKLQREIASFRGKPYGQPLLLVPTEANLGEGSDAPQLSSEKHKMALKQSLRPKRKYRPRRPKDSHAPLRPKSDYVLFANYLRENPDVAEMGFIAISKWVGKQWKGLLPGERAMWSSFAAQQKNQYEIELAEYKKTEQYKAYQRLLWARKAGKPGNRDENIPCGSQEQMECALPIYDASKSKDANVQTNRHSQSDRNITASSFEEQKHSSLAAENTTYSNIRFQKTGTMQDSCKLSDHSDDQDIDFIPYGESPTVASSDSNDTMPYQLMSNSSDEDVRTEAVPIDASDSPQSARSFHIQALNPFYMIPCMAVWPYLELFLNGVNKHNYIINPDMMLHQFNIVIAPSTRLPNHSMCTLCISISIGCQLHKEGSEEMAIMWYENGRRYLDSDDWGWSLNVMRAMALISMFHRNERPSTARHYLDTALRIGEANNLPIMASSDHMVEDTPSREWVLLWSTIRTMAIGQ